MKIDDYIKQNFATKRAFAKHLNISTGMVHYMCRQNYIVIDERLYSPKRRIHKSGNRH